MNHTYKVIFSKTLDAFVATSEIASSMGKTKSERRLRAGRSRSGWRATTLALALGLAGLSGSAYCQVLPAGSVLDINSSAQYATANVFQTYTVAFTPSATGNNYLLFAFRQDPAYWTFGNVILAPVGGSTNMLVDPTFTSGGTVSGQSGLQAPASWGIVYQTGTTPYAAGTWFAPGQAPGASTTNINSGTAGSWYDGAVGSFDGIYQGITLTAGTTYDITFTALSNNSADASGGIELGVFAGPCNVLSGSSSACTPNSTGFTSLATPAQTASAGSSASNITTTVNATGLASSPATVLPVFDGGTLALDGTPLDPYTFSITANNGTIDLAGQSATIANPISDASTGTPGSLTVMNSATGGALTLTAVNTYTGTTTIAGGAAVALSGAGSISTSASVIDNGTLDVSAANAAASIASLGGSGTVVLGSNNLVLTNAADNFSGSINGAGGVIVSGGTQTLSGNNGYTGATAIASGSTLALAGSGSIASSSGVVNAGGTFDLSGATAPVSIASLAGTGTVALGASGLVLTNANGAYAGTIAGNGSVTLQTGTEVLSGSNSYTGGTHLNGGTLVVSSDASLGSATGMLAFNGGTLVTGAGIVSARPITLGANGGTINNAGNNNTFSGLISGAGSLEFTGSGVTTLAAASTYTGGTTVSAGVLQLAPGASIGANVTVASGAVFLPGAGSVSGPASNSGVTLLSAGQTASFGSGLTNAGLLTGTGTIRGTVTNAAGGSLIVGAPVVTGSGYTPSPFGGTTAITGNLTLNAGGNFIFAIAPTATPTAGPGGMAPSNSHTQLDVSGNVALGGALTVYATPGAYLKTTYLLVSADPGTTMTGRFASTDVVDLPAPYGYYVTYVTDPQVLLTVYRNQAFASTSGTTNERGVAAVLDGSVRSATGALDASLEALYRVAPTAQRAAFNAMDGELQADEAAVLASATRESWSPAFAHIGLSDSVAPDLGQSVWISTSSALNQLHGDGNADGTRTAATDFLLGGQTLAEGWTIGAAAGSSQVDAHRFVVGDTASGNLWQIGAFGAHDLGDARVGLLAGYTGGRISFPGSSATTGIWSLQARVAQTLPLSQDDSLTPLAAIDFAHVSVGASHGSDPVFGLDGPSQSGNVADVRLMVRLDHAFTLASLPLTASAGLGVRQLAVEPAHSLNMSFNAGPTAPFVVTGAGEDHSVAQLTAGIASHITETLQFELSYEGDYGHRTRDNKVTGRLNWSF